jgi:hypothetical protein
MTESGTIHTNDQGQQVSEVPGQPGRVTTGRPERVEIARPADPFATIPGAYDDQYEDTTNDGHTHDTRHQGDRCSHPGCSRVQTFEHRDTFGLLDLTSIPSRPQEAPSEHQA